MSRQPISITISTPDGVLHFQSQAEFDTFIDRKSGYSAVYINKGFTYQQIYERVVLGKKPKRASSIPLQRINIPCTCGIMWGIDLCNNPQSPKQIIQVGVLTKLWPKDK